MSVLEVRMQRHTTVSRRPFEDVMRSIATAVGRPDMKAFHARLIAATTVADLEDLIANAVGPSGLMEFGRFDAGEVLRKEHPEGLQKLVRLLIGNPNVMKEMAQRVPDAASYAPVTVLVGDHADGVRVSFDSVASPIAPYGNPVALAVARDLDAQVQSLIDSATQ